MTANANVGGARKATAGDELKMDSIDFVLGS